MTARERDLVRRIEREETEASRRIQSSFARSSGARSSSSSAFSTARPGNFVDAATHEFDGTIRAAREEAARRLQRELERAVQRFAREGESLLAERMTQLGEAGGLRLEKKLGQVSAGLERQRDEFVATLSRRLGEVEADFRERLAALARRGAAALEDAARGAHAQDRPDGLAGRAAARRAAGAPALGLRARRAGILVRRTNHPPRTPMTQIAEHEQSERAKVEGWRLHVLMEAGYPLPLAERLAHSEADLHAAVELVRRGLRPEDRGRDPPLARARSPPGWGSGVPPATRVERIARHARMGVPEARQLRVDRATRLRARAESSRHPGRSIRSVKVEAIEYGDRRVYSVASFNRGIGEWLARLPTVWVEGEVTELRRQDRWQSVFLTLKDPDDGACLAVTMPRGQFDALRLDLANGERVHVYGRPELFEARGDFRLRALSIERFGLGDHLAALERLKQKLAAEGLFDTEPQATAAAPPATHRARHRQRRRGEERRARPRSPRAFRPPGCSSPRRTSRARAPRPRSPTRCARSAEAPEIDVVVLARGGGSFEDLLPFSDERLLRAIAACPVPVVSAVGHEQDTPLSDLVADARASTPTAAARLVVPDLAELTARLERSRTALATGARRALDRERRRLDLSRDHLRRAPLLLLERRRAAVEHSAGRLRALSPRATLDRGYCDRPHSRLDRPLELRGRHRHAGRRRARHRRLRGHRGGHALSELSFEDAQRELETIVQRLESGEASLDEAITLWERGEQLYAVCSSKLDAAQGRIEELARRVEAVKP